MFAGAGTVSLAGRSRVIRPLNHTAHQIGTSMSVFKAGSTVPVKYQLKNADGDLVQAATAPRWLTPVEGSSMCLPIDESVYTDAGDSGSTYIGMTSLTGCLLT